MWIKAAALAATVLAGPAAADVAGDAARLRDRALAGNVAYAIVRDLTTAIGPRLAASAAEAHARDWMAARMTALGLAHVHVQTFAVPHWERGVETATTLGADPQKLSLTALGYSGATSAAGLDAAVVQFADLDALRAAPAGSLAGRIVFIDHAMRATQDGSSYGAFNAIRTAGPAIAASKGAAAYLHRSLATGSARLPHTGVTDWPEGVRPIPAAALGVPDAMQLARMIAAGPVRLHLVLTPRDLGPGTSGNVVGEVPGGPEVVLTGGHLDSWDLGTGAIDDGAGIAIALGAAKVIADAVADGTLPAPRRTIRVVAFGDEEAQGPLGGATYLAAHPEPVALAVEADFGADRVWSLRARLGASAFPGASPFAVPPTLAGLVRVLAPLGIAFSPLPAHGGTDIEAAVTAGAGVVDLAQDGTHYFDLHHSADDTLDKIDPAALTQAVAAYAATLWWAANTDAALRVSRP